MDLMGLGRNLRSNDDYGLKPRVIETIITDTSNGISQRFLGSALGGFLEEGNDHYRGMMAIPGAWRACMLLSDFIARIPWHAYSDKEGVQVKMKNQPRLLEDPNPPWTKLDTFSSMALDLIWHGNSISIIVDRYWDGRPRQIQPVPANNVSVRINRSTSRIEYLVGGIIYDQEDVVHIKGMHAPGELRGMGILEVHLATLNTARDQSKASRNFVNAGVPTGVLSSEDPELDEEGAQTLKRRWNESQQNRGIAVLNHATKFQPIAWNPSELQMVEARKFTLQETALIFGVPLSFLGVETSSRTYRNDESEDNNLLKYSVAGHLNRFEETLSSKFPRGTLIRANLDSVLRASTKDRYAAHQIGIMAGFLLRSEVREKENLPVVPGIDNRPLPGMTQGVAGGNSSDAEVDDIVDEGRIPDRQQTEDI